MPVVTDLEDEGYAEAHSALDMFLFEDVINNWVRGVYGEDYTVTYNGDDYLVLHYPTGKMFPFHVTINRGSDHDWTQDIKDQEWDEYIGE